MPNTSIFTQMFLPIMLLSMLTLPPSALADKVVEQHLYQKTCGSETATLKWQLLGGNPQRIKTELNSEVDQTEMSPSFATNSWKIEDQQQQTKLQVERKQDRLKLSGIFAGKPIDRQKKIDEAPWFQTLSISLRPFVASNNETIEFWAIRPDTLGVHKLKALKKGTEELDIHGQEVKATKLQIRLAGIGALFWKAHYWFRSSDGLFLRYVGPGGLPGAPKIVVELLSSQEK